MQSPKAKHKNKKKSKSKTSGVYYKFSWGDEDMSDSGEEADGTLSPRDLVDKILQETELDNQPIGNDKIPDLDLSFDFLPEMTSFDSHDVRPETLELDDIHKSPDGDTMSDTDSQYEAETPEVLESPLDHPDSGYIDFLTTPSSSGSLSHGKRHSDGLGSDFHSDNDSICSDDITNMNSGDHSKSRSRDIFPNAIRFTKFNFEKLEEDSYIDDEIHKTYKYVSPSGGHIVNSVGERDVTDRECGDLLPMQRSNRLDDDVFDTENQLQETEVNDTNPIIVEQSQQTRRVRRRRRARIKVAIIVLSVVFGLMALASISYLIFRFLVVV